MNFQILGNVALSVIVYLALTWSYQSGLRDGRIQIRAEWYKDQQRCQCCRLPMMRETLQEGRTPNAKRKTRV